MYSDPRMIVAQRRMADRRAEAAEARLAMIAGARTARSRHVDVAGRVSSVIATVVAHRPLLTVPTPSVKSRPSQP